VLAVLLLLGVAGPGQPASNPVGAVQAAEVIAEVRVHGNAVISTEEIVALAGVSPGAPFYAGTPAEIAERLRASGRFRSVEVLKRFASITDPSKIAVVIVVDEGPVHIVWDPDSKSAPRTVRRRGPLLMWLPVLDGEDGYGLTYGVRFAIPNLAGSRSRLAFPLTWGGDKRAAAQLEKDFSCGPFDRVEAGVSASRREHPFYERNNDRVRVWSRLERDVTPQFSAGATVASERVSFLDLDGRFVQTGFDVTFDNRVDPMLARNAIYARAGWNRFGFGRSDAFHQYELDVRGYAGLIGQSVLVARAYRSGADRALPPFLQPILGGFENLRGFRAGTAVGDTLVAGSLELRLPITSPLNIGKLGLNAFVDAGTVYDRPQRLADQRFEKGVGAGVWVSAAFFRLNVAVARGLGNGTRAHFGTTLSF
jgi:outer membrane protein assembly factor BamA